MNEHWSRWIFTSISKHFNDRKRDLTMFIEGQWRKTRGLKDFIELRVDGPRITEVSKGYWKIYCEVNMAIQSTMDDKDNHRIEKSIGIVVMAFSDIYVYRLGDGPQDDGSLLGCLKLIQDIPTRERLQVYRLGQVDNVDKLMQAVVEGHYKMELP